MKSAFPALCLPRSACVCSALLVFAALCLCVAALCLCLPRSACVCRALIMFAALIVFAALCLCLPRSVCRRTNLIWLTDSSPLKASRPPHPGATSAPPKRTRIGQAASVCRLALPPPP